MSAGLIIYAAAAVLAVDTGWQPAPDGGLEYIIQVEPQLVELMREGQVIQSEIPADLQDVRRYRIQIGTAPLPRVGLPTTAARPTDPPGVDLATPMELDSAHSAESPLPSARPTTPPEAIRSLVPPDDEASRDPASVDPGPARRVISSEPSPGVATGAIVEPTPLDDSVTAASPSSPLSGTPALVPLPGREVAPRRAPAPPQPEDTATADPRPSLPVDAVVPVAVETYPSCPAIRTGAAPAVETPIAGHSHADEGTAPAAPSDPPVETTTRSATAGPAPAAGDSGRSATPMLGTTPRFIYTPPPKPKASESSPGAASSGAANDGPKLGLDENVVLPQEPIKVIDPTVEPAAVEPTAPPAPSASGASNARPATGANLPATPPASVEPTAPAMPEATWRPKSAATSDVPRSAAPPTSPATDPTSVEATTADDATAPKPTGAFDWLGTRRDASRPFSTPPTISPTEPTTAVPDTIAGQTAGAGPETTPEAIDPSQGRTESSRLAEPTSSVDATGETSAPVGLLSGAAVRFGGWSIPAGIVVVALIASLGGNLFLAWVAWGMQSKFARLAEQYQISQWKSPPTP